jgi:hypothetical protein
MAIVNAPPVKTIDFTNESEIQERYYPEVESLLQSLLIFDRISIFDHTVRKDVPESPSRPVHHVHVDQTPWSARERVRVHLPELAEDLLKNRVRILNVWRPICGPVYSEPLAFVDSSSVEERDLVAVHHILPTRRGQTFALKHNSNQRWHYWSGMADNENLILQCFDSKSGSRCPHSAFTDPRTPPNAPVRQSIEVRVLLFGG